jgi:predicted MFS family arabinose efflux permease
VVDARETRTDPQRLRTGVEDGRARTPVAVLSRLTLGGEIDRRIGPVVAFSFIYSATFSTFWVYVGIYAVKGLGWHARDVGLVFLLAAPAAAVANYLSGHVSDRTGRKPLIVGSFLAATVTVTVLSIIDSHKIAAFVPIIFLGVVGAPAYSLDRVVVADIVPEGGEREHAYATVRVASNLGVFAGPPLAALLIHLGGWTAFLLGIAAGGIVGAAVTAAFLPRTGGRATHDDRDRGSLRLVLRDRPFVLLLVSTLFAFTVYCGYETVLPVIAVSTYGVAPSVWGLLVVISPLLVILLQLRVTRAGALIPAAMRLALSIALMGLPFLALIVDARVAVIAAVIVVFVLGEMLWMPTSQAVAARLAPVRARGTYFGALAAMTGPAWTLSPLVAFQLRDHAGIAPVWVLFAAVAMAGAAAGVAAIRAAE